MLKPCRSKTLIGNIRVFITERAKTDPEQHREDPQTRTILRAKKVFITKKRTPTSRGNSRDFGIEISQILISLNRIVSDSSELIP